MKTISIAILCTLIISCTNKPKQEGTPQPPINNAIAINDTLKVIAIDTSVVLFPDLLKKEESTKEIYLALTEKPEYPGGMHNLITFIQNSIQYPENAYKTGKQGRVIVQAIIDTDGSVVRPSIVNSVDSLLDKEALRIIKSMPEWKPGKYHGKAIKVKYHFPVTFRITDNNIGVLQPLPRDIPTGEVINPDLLSMQTEYDFYPLSTTEVKVIITNHSHYEYDCGESYSLAYYNNKHNSWETLPTNPIINDILWIFPSEHPTHEQTIKLYTSEVPNRAGKYRIYKAFNRKTKVAYAEFELVDKKGVKKIRQQINDYWTKGSKLPDDTTARNIHSTWIQNDDGDTIYVGLMNNTLRYQEMFRRRVISYSAVSHGKIQQDVPFTQLTFSDTLQITMQTEYPVYPVGTETISVELTNRNPKKLFFGERYNVARKEGNRWILLHDGGVWEDVGYGLEQGDTHLFTARLHPIVNDNKPGTYKIIKEIGFNGSSQKWFMGAEFRIE